MSYNSEEVKVGRSYPVKPHDSRFSKITRPYYWVKVLDLTKTKIKTDQGDFNLRTGGKWGDDYYHADHLHTISDQEAEKLNREWSQQNWRERTLLSFQGQLREGNIEWRKLTDRQLEKILHVINYPEES